MRRKRPAEQDNITVAEGSQGQGRMKRKKIFSQPEWCAAERGGLKDKEMRATAHLAGSLKLQNGDERRAEKGLKVY